MLIEFLLAYTPKEQGGRSVHCFVAVPIAMLSILISLQVAWGTEIPVNATRFRAIPTVVYNKTGLCVDPKADRAWSITDCAFSLALVPIPTVKFRGIALLEDNLAIRSRLDPNWRWSSKCPDLEQST